VHDLTKSLKPHTGGSPEAAMIGAQIVADVVAMAAGATGE
jgi:hypothetical protein